MPLVLQNIKKVLKVNNHCIYNWNCVRDLLYFDEMNCLIGVTPTFFFFQPNGYVLLRDYAIGDLAQVDVTFIFNRVSA